MNTPVRSERRSVPAVRDPSPDAVRRARAAHPTALVHPPRPPLEAVPGRDPAARARRLRRLRRRLLVLLGLGTALALVFGLVLVHVELTAGELRLTRLRNAADKAEVQNLKLRLQVAQLESPARIRSSAERLGMVTPPTITYLTATADAGMPSAAGNAPNPSVAAGGWAMAKRVATAP